jgi:hypothetical protein
MTVGGDSRDRALELPRRMEESRRFAQTQVTGANSQQSPTGDTEQVEITAVYIPEPPANGPAAQKLDAKTKTDAKPASKPRTSPQTPSQTPPHPSPRTSPRTSPKSSAQTSSPKGGKP